MSQKERPDGTEQVTNIFGKKWIRCCSREDMTRVRAGELTNLSLGRLRNKDLQSPGGVNTKRCHQNSIVTSKPSNLHCRCGVVADPDEANLSAREVKFEV